MNNRPDISAQLSPGETLLWQGHPKRGRPISVRSNIMAALLYAVTGALALLGWYVEIYWGHIAAFHLSVYAIIAAAAFATYAGLRITVLDQRRARARDARTAFGITEMRALEQAGPYSAELVFGPGVTAKAEGKRLIIIGLAGQMVFDRLDDAPEARDIVLAQVAGLSEGDT